MHAEHLSPHPAFSDSLSGYWWVPHCRTSLRVAGRLEDPERTYLTPAGEQMWWVVRSPMEYPVSGPHETLLGAMTACVLLMEME